MAHRHRNARPDADSKLIVGWLVGDRDAECADVLMRDVAARLANRVQLTTDGQKAYLDTVSGALRDEVDPPRLRAPRVATARRSASAAVRRR